MTVERVAVEVHFGVKRNHVAFARNDQRVDFDHGGVELGEGFVHAHDELGAGLDLLTFKAETESDLAGVERLNTGGRIDGDQEDFLRGLLGNVFDVHAAFGGSHDGHRRAGAVNQQREIQFPRDIAAFFDVDAFDFLAVGAGLFGDQDFAEHGLGVFLDLIDRLGQTDAAFFGVAVFKTPGATAASVNLRFDDPDIAAKFFGLLGRFVGGVSYTTARNSDAVFRHQLFSLILVNVHPLIRSMWFGK